MTRIRPEPFDYPELFSLISEFYSPILSGKHYGQPSAFAPANLLREARRQKGLPSGEVPPVCVLDPDGDIVRHLRKDSHAKPDPAWACYTPNLLIIRKKVLAMVGERDLSTRHDSLRVSERC